MEFDILGQPPTLHRRRRLVTKELFNGIGYERWILYQRLQLLRMVGQNESGPAKQAGNRFRTSADEKDSKLRAFLGGKAPRDAIRARDLRLHQVGEHVVPGPFSALLYQLSEVVEEPTRRPHGHVVGHANPGLKMEQAVDVVADILTVRRRYAEQHGNDRGGQPSPEILYVVEAVLTLLSIEQTRAEDSYLILELCNPTRCEGLRHQTTQSGVLRRVEEDHHAFGLGLLGHALQDGGMCGAVSLWIPVGSVDILEATQSPEVVLIVVVDRRLVTEPSPHRVRIVFERFVEWIPTQVVRLTGESAHLSITSCLRVRLILVHLS